MSLGGYVVGTCSPSTDNYIAEWAPGALDTLMTSESCCSSIDGTALAVTDTHYITGFVLNFGPPQTFLRRPGAPSFDIIGVYLGSPEVSKGLAVNDKGWVAGWGIVDPVGADTAALVWPLGGAEIRLSDYGQATGIDPNFTVVGWHRPMPGGPTTAFIWSRGGGIFDLPGLLSGGAGKSAAVAIDPAAHQVLGWAIDAGGLQHVVTWTF